MGAKRPKSLVCLYYGVRIVLTYKLIFQQEILNPIMCDTTLLLYSYWIRFLYYSMCLLHESLVFFHGSLGTRTFKHKCHLKTIFLIKISINPTINWFNLKECFNKIKRMLQLGLLRGLTTEDREGREGGV